jgi:hypothetical protein
MRFNPRDADANLLPEDWYDASIADAVDSVSRKGNSMVVVTFKIYDDRGLQPTIDRYFTNNPSGLGGLRKLCRAVGLSDRFDSGDLNPNELKGKDLRILVKIEEDETGKYPDKNVAAAFEARKPTTAKEQKETVAEFPHSPTFPNDDIPF